jgi:hypothetical protein
MRALPVVLLVATCAVLVACGSPKPVQSSSSAQPTGEASPLPVDTSGPEVMTAAQFRRGMTRDRTRLLGDLARIARAGADGKIDDAAFGALSDDAEAATIAWTDVALPASLKALAGRWNGAMGKATDLAEPSSGALRDLRGTRAPARALLSSLEAAGAPAGSGVCRQAAADLQRGLWVTPAQAVPMHSYATIGYKELTKNAAALVGHRYVLRALVVDVQDAGVGEYFTGYPDGIEPRIIMGVEMTDEGYGAWEDDVEVIYDGALKNVRKNHVVAIYGTFLGQDSVPTAEGYDETMLLIHAKSVVAQ